METVSYVIWALVIIFILGPVSLFNLPPHGKLHAQMRSARQEWTMSQPLIHHFAHTHQIVREMQRTDR